MRSLPQPYIETDLPGSVYVLSGSWHLRSSPISGQNVFYAEEGDVVIFMGEKISTRYLFLTRFGLMWICEDFFQFETTLHI